ncbi:PAS domain-containing protein [Dyadobacter flavalbus]|uniref:histidine kinase n=1 Tax=Dyadobacter flavalbus TaxID=2579942 RepID=A0A5M8QYD5_9BACT|nr:PAS domain-containing protein [Dyadobacter flavalbus]KAA6440411.1 PAS domain-containing protein [Dyadobacter flavalbus]
MTMTTDLVDAFLIDEYKQLVELFAQAVWETDAHGQVVADSSSWRAYTGQSKQEWLGEGWVGAVHPEDRGYALDQWQKAVSSQTPVNAEFRLRSPGGGWRWTNVRATHILDADGSVKKWVGLNIGIEEKKKAEQLLQQEQIRLQEEVSDRTSELASSRQLHQAILDSTLEMIQVFTAVRSEDGQIIDFVWRLNNHAAEQHYGDVIGTSLLSNNPGVIETGIFDTFRQVVETGIADKSERHYNNEQFEGWFYQSTVKLGDGVATTTTDITALKKAEEQTRSSQLLLQSVIDNSLDIIQVFKAVRDETGQIIDFTCAVNNKKGIEQNGDVIGRSLLQVNPGVVASGVFDRMVKVAQTGEPQQLEQYYAHEQFDVWFYQMLVNTVDGVAMMTREITERKQNELRRDFLLRLNDAIRPLADPVTIQDTAARLLGEQLGTDRAYYAEMDETSGNCAVVRQWHRPGTGNARSYSLAEWSMPGLIDGRTRVVRNTNSDPAIADDQREPLQRNQIGATIVVPLVKEGRLVAKFVTHQRAPRNWTATDVSLAEETAERTWAAVERAKTVEALRQSEEQFRLLGVASSDSIYKMNPNWTRMRLLSGKTFLADTNDPGSSWIQTYIPAEDQPWVQQVIQEAIRTKSTFEREHRVRKVEGGTGWIFSSAIPVFDKKGDIQEWLGAASDITARKLAEEKLHDSSRRKDEFLAMLAHELRNPMATLRNGVSILELTSTEEPARSTVEMMSRQSDHLERMLDDLLDVSRISSGKIELKTERVDLVSLVAQAVESMQSLFQKQGRSLKADLPATPIYLAGDATRLMQVVTNLLTNGARYTGEQGQVWLRLREEQMQAVLEVGDNGIGLPADQLSSIFELFVQVDNSLARSKGGLGLGLALVKRLVEQHGGRAEARSEGLGKGSVFTIYLPTLMLPAMQTPTPEHQASEPLDSRRILVIDDNADSAQTMGMLLKLKGYEAHTRNSGQAGLEAAEQLLPAAILLDIGMPGLDGYDTCRLIRQQSWGQNMLVLALTGYSQHEDRRLTKEAGFDEHLVKPVDLEVLINLLKTMLDRNHKITKLK